MTPRSRVVMVASVVWIAATQVPTGTAATADPRTGQGSRAATDCRYHPNAFDEGDDERGFEQSVFPRDDLFRPPTADPTEMRFFSSFGWAEFQPDLSREEGFDHFIQSVVGLGGTAGLWTRRREQSCDGVQVNIFGGAISTFAIDPLFLVNVDYYGGLSLSLKRDELSARLRVYHQSGHLGDDFLFENPGFPQEELSLEAVDVLGSVTGSWWRLYAGPGVVVRAKPTDLGRGMVRAGAEIRPERLELPIPSSRVTWAPVAATDLLSHQARDWGVTWSSKAGIAITTARHDRHLRFLVTFLDGYMPYGVFFDAHETTQLGLEAQFVY